MPTNKDLIKENKTTIEALQVADPLGNVTSSVLKSSSELLKK
jgi:hypothetical protein